MSLIDAEKEELREENARMKTALETVAMSGDELGDRMKMYEHVEAMRRAMPLVPVIARLDGRCFSNFTRGMERPFDRRFVIMMQQVTRHMVAETNACAGYCESDEITLAWYSATTKSQVYFDGRIQKMVSTLAAEATLEFNRILPDYLPPEYAARRPTFDCRVWSVPTLEEGANAFLWRQNDAAKNSVQMAARHYFSHRELLGKHGGEMQEMLFSKGVNWNDYPAEFKRGTFVQRHIVRRKFSAAEIDKLPPKHDARKNPDLEVERTEYQMRDLWLSKISNRTGVLFRGEEPTEMEAQQR